MTQVSEFSAMHSLATVHETRQQCINASLCTLRSNSGHKFVAAARAGLVFMAFGFNLVDCGGLLGQRLGKNIDYAAMRSLKKAKSAAL